MQYVYSNVDECLNAIAQEGSVGYVRAAIGAGCEVKKAANYLAEKIVSRSASSRVSVVRMPQFILIFWFNIFARCILSVRKGRHVIVIYDLDRTKSPEHLIKKALHVAPLLQFVAIDRYKNNIREIAGEVLEIVNALRRQRGLGQLTENEHLTAAAIAHAREIGETRKKSHVACDGSTPQQRARRYAYNRRVQGENLIIGAIESQEVVDYWMNSPPHRKNILNPNSIEIGVGVARGSGLDDGHIFSPSIVAIFGGGKVKRITPGRLYRYVRFRVISFSLKGV